MKQNKYKRVSILLLVTCLLLSLTACNSKEEPIVEEPVVEEEVVEIVDDDIKGIDNLIKANEYLHFEKVDKAKYYSLEEVTVYLMNLFSLSQQALDSDYQCPFNSVKKENKPIIAYAYSTWLLSGVTEEDVTDSNSDKTINNTASVLLALMGYKNHTDDKDYDSGTATTFLKTLGIELKSNTGKLRGDYLIKLLNDMLDKTCKDEKTVKDKLMDLNMFTKQEYEDSTYLAKGEAIPEKKKVEAKKPTVSTSSTPAVDYTDSGSSSGSSDSGSSSGGGGGSDSGGGGGGYTPPSDPEPSDPEPSDPEPSDPGSGGGGGDSELPTVDF